MFSLKNIVKSFLKIIPPIPQQMMIYKEFDEQTNAFQNRIWYSGKAYELNQFYKQIENCNYSFWGSVPTSGHEIRKIHTGIPRLMVDAITSIVTADFNGVTIDDETSRAVWAQIEEENDIYNIIEDAIRQTLIVGDGAFKLSLDSDVSQYPIIEFVPGDKMRIEYDRGRIKEIVFYKTYTRSGREYRLEETYGRGYVRYKLYRDETELALETLTETKDLKDVSYTGNFIMAVPLIFIKSAEHKGRGQSLFDGKIDNFDSLDETYSQWVQALRDCRPKTYIPESLIPRNGATGGLMCPNPFDNQYIKIGDDMSENAKNSVDVKQPSLPVDGYVQTYMTALDLCLQGIISPSTLGIDTKKLDNAEAQREKEKTTLYTRQKVVTALTKSLSQLIQTTFDTYYTAQAQNIKEIKCSVTFGEYASPSFEAVVETLSNPNTPMSIESKVEEMWGSTKDDTWKAEEVQRIKEQTGLVAADEPSLGGAVSETVIGGFLNG